jgi:ABC-type transport system involved in multi-copper enzyme maturation permease subunit
MSAATESPRSATRGSRVGDVVRSEWTKFHTVRGWVVGAVVAVLLTVLFTFLVSNGSHSGMCTGESPATATCTTGHPFVPTGPNGEAVADSYYFVDQPLTGNGTITVRVTSLTDVVSTNAPNRASAGADAVAQSRPGLASWAKAGILITPSTKQGSVYAAVMVTGGHGVRFQYDYTHDRAGLPGPVSATTPRWLRLVRSGDALTSYDSTDGTNWNEIGSARLAGLPATVDVGLFTTSPVSYEPPNNGQPTLATATFDQVNLQGQGVSNVWSGQSIGAGQPNSDEFGDFYPTLTAGSFQRSADAFVVSGSGDIAPAVSLAGNGTASSSLLFGLIVALIVVIVVATLFITAEYRRGLIRTTFTATPLRHRVLVAKVVVIGGVTFVVGALAAAIAIPLGVHVLNSNGNYVFPSSAMAVAGIIAGTGALLAVTAIAVLALGTILRSSAAAVTLGIVVFVLPYILGQFLSGSANRWLFRLTPAAGFSVLGILPRSALVSYPYTLANGYYPLAPWAGLAVLCVYAALALGFAAIQLNRRDV